MTINSVAMSNQKGFVHLFILLILLAGVGVGLYLVQHPAIFQPKASESSIDPETFRLQNLKTQEERYLNPFGEAWETKIAYNPDIPIMLEGVFDRTVGGGYGVTELQTQFNRLLPDYTPAQYPDPDKTYRLVLSPGYVNLLKNAGPAFAYFGGSGFDSNKPRVDMPVQKIVDSEVKKINPNLKLFGYHVIAFTEECDLAGYPPMNCKADYWPSDSTKESWFLHKKGASIVPSERLQAGAGHYIFDVTNTSFQDFFVDQLVQSMQANGLDAVLIDAAADYTRPPYLDGSGNYYPYPGVGGCDKYPNSDFCKYYPDNYTDDSYFNGKVAILSKIKAKLTPLGKKVIANPIQTDATVMDDTRIEQIKYVLNASDGFYWEDAFAPEKRNAISDAYGPDYWYDRLQLFFDTVSQAGKMLVVESNTAISGSIPKGYCKPALLCEYRKKLDEVGYNSWLKEEQRIARLNLGMYLLFMDPKTTVYKHHTLMEEQSYELSEDHWADYDLKLGKPLAPKEKIASNIYRRWFNNGIVYVNNSPTLSYTVPSGVLACETMKNNVCVKSHFVTAEGIPTNSYTLAPGTAMFFVLPSVLEPYNPSFETVWNWKPNQESWGGVDYSIFHSGKRSFKIQSGLSGSPGLSQSYTFQPNTTYTWSAWVKTENNANPEVVAVAVPGGVSSPNKVSDNRFVYDDIVPTGTNDWKKIQMSFTSQQGGTGNLYAALQNGSNGTVWFDDVKIEEGSPLTLLKPVAYCDEQSISHISLSWTNAGNYIYKIFTRDLTNINAEPQIGETSGTGFNFTPTQGLIPGHSYGFAVQTTTSGTVYAENSWSDQAFGATTAPICTSSSPTPTPTPTLNPLDMTAKTVAYCNDSISRIHLEWVPTGGTSTYTIYRSISGNPGAGFKTFIANIYAYNDETVTPGIIYEYVISNGSTGGKSKLLKAVSCP